MQNPIVIGGLGGSGTRVVARIVRRAGFFMGTNVTGAEDAVEFWEFYDRWINRYHFRQEVPLFAEESRLMEDDLSGCVARHLCGIAAESSPWGWKNPRSILVLPFLHKRYPGMKFIHVVRDGRDMAFSTTAQDQLRMHGAAVLRGFCPDTAEEIRTAGFWARINLQGLQYETDYMKNQHLVMRFEDLCMNPAEAVCRIFSFVAGEPPPDAPRIAAETITDPSSIGRWRNQEPEGVAAIHDCAGDALRVFGYA